LHEQLKIPAHDVIEHSEEADEVAFSRPVWSDQDIDATEIQIKSLDRLETLNLEMFELLHGETLGIGEAEPSNRLRGMISGILSVT
jgi:hypothetical protein